MKYREASDPRRKYGEALLEMAAYLLAMENLKCAEQPLSEAEEHLLEAQYRRTQPEMGRRLRAAERRHRWRSAARKRIPQVLKAAAILILVLNLSVAVACAVNEAVRARVLEFMFTIRTECTELSFAPTGETVEVPPEWTFSFYPTYIPEGYALFDVAVTGDIGTVVYVKQGDDHLSFTISGLNAEGNFNTEGMKITYGKIHNREALFAEKEGCVRIIWSEANWCFVLSMYNDGVPLAQLREESMRMAESFAVIQTDRGGRTEMPDAND